MLHPLSMKSRVPSSDLTQAIWNCDLPYLQGLIAKGADLDKQAGRWAMFAYSTPLGAAIEHASLVVNPKSIELNQICVEAGLGEPIDHWAKRAILVEMVKLILKAGANPNKICISRSPLNLACHNGDLEVVKILLENRADPAGIAESPLSRLSEKIGRKMISGYFNTSLHEAAEIGRLDIVKVLIAAGAGPLRSDHTGATAAEVAITHNHQEVFDYLKSLTLSQPYQSQSNLSDQH